MPKYNKYEKHRLQKDNKRKKKKARKKFLFKAGILIILLMAIVSVGVFVIMEDFQFSGKEGLVVSSKLNFLVLGSDASQSGVDRADFIAVVSIDLENGKLGILSLPRDTRVQIPGQQGYHKLNAAYAYGDAHLLQKTVENVLKVPIDYHVSTDFNGFRDIINTLGGVKVNVAKHLKYIDQAGGLYINIPAGEQVLYGQQALEYIRFRHDELGDIGRIKRQQKFLNAVMDKISKPGVLLKLPQLIKYLADNINTDLPLTEGLKLATKLTSYLKNLEENKIEMKTLPGNPKYIDGVSYWMPDWQESEMVVSNLIRSKDYLSNSKLNVTILNGSGQKNIASRVGELLSQSGYNVVETGNADNFNYSQTQIFFKPDAKLKAKKLAGYLNGKLINWQQGDPEPKETNEVDIKIILGETSNHI